MKPRVAVTPSLSLFNHIQGFVDFLRRAKLNIRLGIMVLKDRLFTLHGNPYIVLLKLLIAWSIAQQVSGREVV